MGNELNKQKQPTLVVFVYCYFEYRRIVDT